MTCFYFNFYIWLHSATKRTTVYKDYVYMAINLYNGQYATERTTKYNDKVYVTSICTIVSVACGERGSNT